MQDWKKDVYFALHHTLINNMKGNLRRYLNPHNLVAFFLWAFVMALVIYWNNAQHV